jgi:DNA replication licensing factor MCM5
LQRIASHIIKVHASGAAASGKQTDASEGENWLKRLVERCIF